MRYRQRAFSPQGEIAEMLDALCARVEGQELTLVFNGDVFDLDAPRVINNVSVFHDFPRTAEHAVPAVSGILDDHPEFLAAVGRVLAAGHTVLFISGNHDVQLVLPEVREVLVSRLADAAIAAGASDAARAAIARRVLFRAWFHKSADGILIEHGNQYDPYCSYRYPMSPFARDGRAIQPTMGSLATRFLASRMGYFNPHVDSSFMLSVVGYLTHWARYYLFSRRSIALTWALGAVRTLLRLRRCRDPLQRSRWRASVDACARETGVPAKIVVRHARLFARPVEDQLGLVARVLWLDQAALLLLAILITVGWLWLAPGALAIGALLGPMMVLGYGIAVPTMSLSTHWKQVSRFSQEVCKVHRARAVVFGHTHNPEGAWERGIFFGNTGSWSAAFRDLACTEPLFDERPLVWLTCDARGELHGGLYGWRKGRFEPREVRDSEVVPGDSRLAELSAERAAESLGSTEKEDRAPLLEDGLRQSVGTVRARITPGIEAANAIPKNTVNPTRDAR